MPNSNSSFVVFCLDRSESDENGESQEQKDYKREFFDMLDEVKHVTKLMKVRQALSGSELSFFTLRIVLYDLPSYCGKCVLSIIRRSQEPWWPFSDVTHQYRLKYDFE